MGTEPRLRCVELAWEAYRAGSFPVGAVIVDANGATVAEGRNRIGESEAPPGRLRQNGLAHAEMDALAQLPWGTSYREHTLYTSLEPCVLCRSATVMVGIGHVVYLGADPFCHGLDQMIEINSHIKRNHPRWTGPEQTREAHFSAVLAMAVVVFSNGGDNPILDEYDASTPKLMAAARRMVADGLWPSKRLELADAIALLTPVLDDLEGSGLW